MPQNILIVKLSSLGDLLQTFPVVDYLTQKHPNVQIDWVTERAGAPLLECHPHLHKVHVADTKVWRASPFASRKEMKAFKQTLTQTHYDVVFDLQGNCKSLLCTLAAVAPTKVGFGWKCVPEWPNLLGTNKRYTPPPGHNRRADYLYLVQSYFQDTSHFTPKGVTLHATSHHTLETEGNNFLIAPGSFWKNKQLPETSWKQLLTHLEQKEDPHFHFVYGTDEELALCRRLEKGVKRGHLVEKMSLPSLQHLISMCDRVYAVDSLVLHLAGTTSTPTVAFFGPSHANTYQPLGSHHLSLQGTCPYKVNFSMRCPHLRTCKTARCMQQLIDINK